MKLTFSFFYSFATVKLIICLAGMEKFEKVRVNENNYEMVKNLHGNWYSAGLKAIIGKLGSDLYKKMHTGAQKQLATCLNNIEDKRDLVMSSQCLVKFRKNFLNGISQGKRKIDKVTNIGGFAVEQSNEKVQKSRASFKQNAISRIRRSSQFDQRNTKTDIEWGKRLGRVLNERNAKKLDRFKKARQLEQWKKLHDINKIKIKQTQSQDKLPSRADRSALFKISNLIDKFFGNDEKAEDKKDNALPKWPQLYDALVKIKAMNDQKRKSPGARVYEMRMYDLVLGRDEPSLSPKEMKTGNGILKMGIQLLNKLRNTTGTNSNLKMMSPRFAPLMPEAIVPNDEANDKNNLSPTILALYELDTDQRTENVPESAASSLPQLLKLLGVNSQDREALLHTLLDVSGSVGHVQKAMDTLKALNFFEIEPDLIDANKRIVDAFTTMEQTFDEEQQQEMQKEGWTFLRQSQYDKLCMDQYAQFPDDLRSNFQQISQMTREAREAMLWKRIERISRNIPDEIADKLDRRKMEKFARLAGQKRRKRQQPVGGISALNPSIRFGPADPFAKPFFSYHFGTVCPFPVYFVAGGANANNFVALCAWSVHFVSNGIGTIHSHTLRAFTKYSEPLCAEPAYTQPYSSKPRHFISTNSWRSNSVPIRWFPGNINRFNLNGLCTFSKCIIVIR
uniref:Uncharacterized protein n=1 Tax=Globodera rostochiensis TaxID=31243 RepID=A0A914HFY0_GLORO